LPGSRFLEDAVWARPLGDVHEESPAVHASEHAGKASAVELDGIEHLAALRHPNAAAVGDVGVPHCSLRIEADPVGHPLAETSPLPAIGERRLFSNVERDELLAV